MLEHYLKLAYSIATYSPDPSSQNGAIVIPKNDSGIAKRQIPGYNHIYTGIPQTYDDREKKYERVAHAEADAILQCGVQGVCTGGATLVCPWASCRACAISIIGSGISELVFHEDRMWLGTSWDEQVREAHGWLRDHGIILTPVTGPIADAPDIRISGRMWSPRTLEYVD